MTLLSERTKALRNKRRTFAGVGQSIVAINNQTKILLGCHKIRYASDTSAICTVVAVITKIWVTERLCLLLFGDL